jgi:hypothetical protein
MVERPGTPREIAFEKLLHLRTFSNIYRILARHASLRFCAGFSKSLMRNDAPWFHYTELYPNSQ